MTTWTARRPNGDVIFAWEARSELITDDDRAAMAGLIRRHDSVALALDEPARAAMPTLAELRPPDDLDGQWDCFAEDEGGWPEVAPVSRRRRLLEWVLYG